MSGAIKTVKSVEGLAKKAVDIYRYFFPSTYAKLSDEDKSIFDNCNPVLASKAKLADTFSDISATCGAYFGFVYIGVELSSILGLLAIGSMFSVVAFGLMLFSVLTWMVSNVYHLVFVEREREAILKNDDGFQQMVESIKELRQESKTLTIELVKLRDYFTKWLNWSHPDDAHHCVATACLEYIEYASDLMSPDVVQIIIDGMSNHIDYEHGKIPDSPEKRDADKVAETVEYVSNSIQLPLAINSNQKSVKNKKKHKKNQPAMDPKFMQSWMKLVGNMPRKSFNPGDGQQVHVEYLDEMAEISTALPLLKAIAYSIQTGEDVSHLSDALYPALQQSLNHHAIFQPSSSPSKVQLEDLSLQSRPSRLLQKPPIDVPRIVGKVFVDAAAEQSKISNESKAEVKPSLIPAFMRWLDK